MRLSKNMKSGLVLVALVGTMVGAISCLHVCAEEELAPGPSLAERTKLKERIEKLKADGVGVKPYQDALGSIEESIVAKESDEQVQKSVERLNSALDQQMKSKAAITSNTFYHVHGSPSPNHATASASAGGDAPSGGGGAAMPHLPKGFSPEMIEKALQAHPEMRQKYEDYKKSGHL